MKIRMDHTKAVTLCKDISGFKWIADDKTCGEDFSLPVFGNFLKCIFYQKPRLNL